MKRFKRLNSTGDTIVEVLIVLAVLGLAFAISTATANRGIHQSRNAEEHAQALGVLDSQLEMVQTAASNQFDKVFDNPGQPFCMTKANELKPVQTNPADPVTINNDASSDTLNYNSDCVSNELYHTSVVYDGGVFTVRVRWDGVGALGRQQELMTYRVNKLTPTKDLGIELGTEATQVVINVHSIVPDLKDFTGDPSPDCNLPATRSVGGVSTSLTQEGQNVTGSPKDTSTEGTAVYSQNIQDNADYQASMVLPPNYKRCGDLSKPVEGALGNEPVDFKITPICKNYTVPDPDEIIYSDWYNLGHHPIYGGWYNVGHQPVYGPTYIYAYVQGARKGGDGWHSWSDNPHIEFGNYYGMDPSRSDGNPNHHWYNVWEAVPLYTRDFWGYTPDDWRRDVVGYTADDWRRDILRVIPHSHPEKRCPPSD